MTAASTSTEHQCTGREGGDTAYYLDSEFRVLEDCSRPRVMGSPLCCSAGETVGGKSCSRNPTQESLHKLEQAFSVGEGGLQNGTPLQLMQKSCAFTWKVDRIQCPRKGSGAESAQTQQNSTINSSKDSRVSDPVKSSSSTSQLHRRAQRGSVTSWITGLDQNTVTQIHGGRGEDELQNNSSSFTN